MQGKPTGLPSHVRVGRLLPQACELPLCTLAVLRLRLHKFLCGARALRQRSPGAAAGARNILRAARACRQRKRSEEEKAAAKAVAVEREATPQARAR